MLNSRRVLCDSTSRFCRFVVWSVGAQYFTFLGSGPEGIDAMTYVFTHGEISSPSSSSAHPNPANSGPRHPIPSLQAPIPASKPKCLPQGPNPSLKAQILASRPKLQHQRPNPSIKAKIPASRPKYQYQGPNTSLKA